MKFLEYHVPNGLTEKMEYSIQHPNLFIYIILAACLLTCAAFVGIVRHQIKSADTFRKNGETYYHMIAEVEDYAIILLDKNGDIKSWNKGAEKIKGYTTAEITGKNFRLFYADEDQALHLPERLIEQAALEGKAAHEGWRVRKDRSRFWGSIVITAIHNNSKQVTGFTKVTRDLTDRKKSEDKFRALLNAAPDATVIVNETGVIEMVNNQTEELFGYPREELLGKPVEILIPAPFTTEHIRHPHAFSTNPKTKTMGTGIELHAIRKNGSKFPVEISLSPLQTEEGLLVSAAVRDISSRKELENALHKSNAEMEAFTYSVSHDLRAPIRGIIGFTAILEQDYAEKIDDEGRRIMAMIQANTSKMGHLIDDLLAFSRAGKKEIIKTNINTLVLVNGVIEELMQQNKAGHTIGWQLQPLPDMYADPGTIRQVWINLISNAIKYSSQNTAPRIEIGTVKDGEQIGFYIKDNGVGFNETYKDKLFKVFERLHDDETFEGTGVGLALVEKIISKHGGKVWARGIEGEGACFNFSLPAMMKQ